MSVIDTVELAPVVTTPVEYNFKDLAVGMAAYVYVEPQENEPDTALPELVCYGEVAGVPGQSTPLNSAPSYVSIREKDAITGEFVEHPEFQGAEVTKLFWPNLGPRRYRFFDRLLGSTAEA